MAGLFEGDVCKDSIRFLHLSDTHFGVHYALKPRNLLRRAYSELFFQKVEDVIREAISIHKVDFIIHSGDFFNRSKPSPEVLDRGVKPFQLAARKGIPVFITPGNHERSKLPIGLLPFAIDNINLFSEPCSCLFEKNGLTIKITGFPYVRYKARKNFSEILSKAWNNSSTHKSRKYDFSILVVHQLLAGSCIEGYTFCKGYNVVPMLQVLRKFNYVACGHVHRFQFLYERGKPLLKSTNGFFRVIQDYGAGSWHFDDECCSCSSFPNPVIAYAGSLERVSIKEGNEPKGYIIGELNPSPAGQGTVNVKYRFHELSAVKMIYKTWNLSKSSMKNYINQTLEEMYDFHSTCKSKREKPQQGLTGIIEIRIRGNGLHNNAFMDHFKQEAKRLRFYLKFRVYA
ncbi:MAG: metallophosphoesterase [Candidatus Bathyarchaeota archaeon]|nr:MAG: metallophosphoesterase [Candidatus Bathyarchaeota archaeon]